MDKEKPKDEEPPVLRIKKDALVNRDFHYKREERLERSTAPREPREMKGFFRGLFKRGKRRGGFGSLIVVLVAVSVVLLVFRLGGQGTDKADIGGFQATLRAITIMDALSVSVTFDPGGKSSRGVETAPPAMVRFILPDTGQSLIVSEILPLEGTVLRGKMRFTGKEKRISAEVKVGDKTLTLSLPIAAPLNQP
jgi:hypothetical protein